MASAPLSERKRQPAGRGLRRRLREHAVPDQDRLRPGVRAVLAVQAPHLLRREERVRRGPDHTRFPGCSRTVEAGMDADGPRASVAVRLRRHSQGTTTPSRKVPAGTGVEEMERVSMFVPTYQGLSATDVLRSAGSRAQCFPFTAPRAVRFYRARNAIYHLFKALRAERRTLTVLAPDYYSGNEILAMRAAGATIHYCPVGRDMT